MNFNEINLSEKTLKALESIGYTEMTAIQEKAIPMVLEGNDLIGQAQTGTGKTLAFALPILEKTTYKNKGVEHLILAPTRELAMQIMDEFIKVNEFHRFKIAAIIGGVDYSRQIRNLSNNPHIIIATPGRIIDHLRNNKVTLDNLKTFTLDEADEMLKNGFKEEIEDIIKYLPKSRQSLLFSATINKDLKAIINNLMNNPKEILISTKLQVTSTIDQYAIITKEKQKFETLTRILDLYPNEQSIIFGRTKRRVDELTAALNTCGYNARALHGDISQSQRTQTMKEFKNNSFNILIATDVAARGIDISSVTHVYNFDLPQEIEYYVHRIGRTGRAGKNGVSISFVRDSELLHIENIQRETKSDIKIIDAPTHQEVKMAKQMEAVELLEGIIKEGKLNKNLGVAKQLIETYGADVVVAAAIDNLTSKKNFTQVELSGEPPVVVRQQRRNDRYDRNRNNNNRNRDDRRRRDDKKKHYNSFKDRSRKKNK